MRHISLLLGVAIVAFGVFLVASHGSVAGVNLPALVGIPTCSTSGNSTSFCPGFGGYSIGTVVVLFGLGLIGNGLRSMGTTAMIGSNAGAAGFFPPQMLASMEAAAKHMQTMGAMTPGAGPGPGMRPGVVYCAKCGRANNADAAFCQQCGGPMTTPPPQNASIPGPPPPGSSPTPSSEPAASKPGPP